MNCLLLTNSDSGDLEITTPILERKSLRTKLVDLIINPVVPREASVYNKEDQVKAPAKLLQNWMEMI